MTHMRLSQERRDEILDGHGDAEKGWHFDITVWEYEDDDEPQMCGVSGCPSTATMLARMPGLELADSWPCSRCCDAHRDEMGEAFTSTIKAVLCGARFDTETGQIIRTKPIPMKKQKKRLYDRLRLIPAIWPTLICNHGGCLSAAVYTVCTDPMSCEEEFPCRELVSCTEHADTLRWVQSVPLRNLASGIVRNQVDLASGTIETVFGNGQVMHGTVAPTTEFYGGHD